MAYTTVLLQKITDIEGLDLHAPAPLELTFTVPQGCAAGVQYVRAGNTSPGMVNITLLKNGKTMRHFPISGGGATHVPLSIVEDLRPGTGVEVGAAAERAGTLLPDIGILEVSTAGSTARSRSNAPARAPFPSQSGPAILRLEI